MNTFAVAVFCVAVAMASAGHLGLGVIGVNPAAHIASGSVSVGVNGAVVAGPAGSVRTDNGLGGHGAGAQISGPSGDIRTRGGAVAIDGPGLGHGVGVVAAPVAVAAPIVPVATAAVVGPAAHATIVGPRASATIIGPSASAAVIAPAVSHAAIIPAVSSGIVAPGLVGGWGHGIVGNGIVAPGVGLVGGWGRGIGGHGIVGHGW